MTETKHTAPPWTVREDMLEIEASIGPGEKALIASCFEGDKYRVPPSEAKANLHLISAAPDLLAACEETQHYFQHPIEPRSWEKEKKILKSLCEAIAKAKGEEVPA